MDLDGLDGPDYLDWMKGFGELEDLGVCLPAGLRIWDCTALGRDLLFCASTSLTFN